MFEYNVFCLFVVLCVVKVDCKVCSEQKVVNSVQIVSYVQTYAVSYNTICVKKMMDYENYETIDKTYKCLKTATKSKMSTRYEPQAVNKTLYFCCPGYSQMYVANSKSTNEKDINCEPICNPPCLNGICVEPQKCLCLPGYIKSPDTTDPCLPVCDLDCGHGICIKPNTCKCFSGYELTNTGSQAVCTKIQYKDIECISGYIKSSNGTCIPKCSKGCINGICISPEICKCNFGFHLTTDHFDGLEICTPDCNPGYKKLEGICFPECRHSCGNGTCILPNVCVCFRGYKFSSQANSNGFLCIPSCTGVCAGECIAPNTCITSTPTAPSSTTATGSWMRTIQSTTTSLTTHSTTSRSTAYSKTTPRTTSSSSTTFSWTTPRTTTSRSTPLTSTSSSAPYWWTTPRTTTSRSTPFWLTTPRTTTSRSTLYWWTTPRTTTSRSTPYWRTTPRATTSNSTPYWSTTPRTTTFRSTPYWWTTPRTTTSRSTPYWWTTPRTTTSNSTPYWLTTPRTTTFRSTPYWWTTPRTTTSRTTPYWWTTRQTNTTPRSTTLWSTTPVLPSLSTTQQYTEMNSTKTATMNPSESIYNGADKTWMEQHWASVLLPVLLLLFAILVMIIVWRRKPIIIYLRGRSYVVEDDILNGNNIDQRVHYSRKKENVECK